MIKYDFDPAEAGKVFTGTIDDAIAQIRGDVAPKDKTSRDPAIFTGQYDSGYKHGFADGQATKRNQFGEQDFAYKHADYVRGYWNGFRDGRK